MRFYEPSINKDALNTVVQLSQDNSHHFSRVLRGKSGDQVILFNGKEGEFVGDVTIVENRQVFVNVASYNNQNRTPLRQQHLVVALCSKQKMAQIIQKATELGVSTIHQVRSARAQVSAKSTYTSNDHERYQKIIIAAAMQCGLNQLPILMHPCAISDLPWSDWQSADQHICHPHGESIDPMPVGTQDVWFIGPEGGWEDGELDFLIGKGGRKRTLCKTVLRMETAAIVALSQNSQ